LGAALTPAACGRHPLARHTGEGTGEPGYPLAGRARGEG
jgi:hypothetical protein